MKTLKKFWGVALVVVMLATLFLGTAVPASAANYAFSADLTQPTVAGGGLSAATFYNTTAVVTVAFVDGVDTLAETIGITYTDQDGTVGNAGQVVIPAGAALATVVPITLAAGDTGIRRVTAAAAVTSDATAGVLTFRGSDGVVVMATITAGPPIVFANVAANTLGTVNFSDVAQSGSVIYATANNPAGTSTLYKSLNGGASWFPCAATNIPNVALTDSWTLVAVAPDDPNFVVVVNTLPAADLVYASTDGGTFFSALPGVSAATAFINDVSVSAPGPSRLIAIGGANAAPATVSSVEYWTIGTMAGAWLPLVPPNGVDSVAAVEFSPNFAADNSLLVVSIANTGVFTSFVECYSFNGIPALGWNPVGYNFPRTLDVDVAGGAVINKATLALDTNFYLGDESTQIGFVAAGITGSGVTGEQGGIWRFDYAAAAGNPLTKIYGTAAAGLAVNSVAWDGTNLIAGIRGAGPISIIRSANALSVIPSFIANPVLKTPGTGTLPLVLFNGGNALCFSTGSNAGVAKSIDLGKSWNGIALLNTNFVNILDFWVSPDGAQTYVLTDDGTDINLWSKTGSTWERVMIIAAATTQTWLVRADKDTPNTIYVARQGAATIYKSLDGGQTTWTTRASAALIRDFVVQDANTIYVAVNGAATVIKSTNGAFTWGLPVATGLALFGNTIYSLTQIADDQLLVGGNAGFVAYSADGNTSWTNIFVGVGVGNTLVTASGLAAGDTIWATAVAGGAGSVANWVIGTNTPLTGWNVSPTAPTSNDGLAYVNGTLYILDSGANLYRFLYPTGAFGVIFGTTDTIATALVYAGGTTINALQSYTGSTTLVARSVAAGDTMQSYTLYLNAATDAPVPTYPINNAIIPINSIAGGVNAFVFQWNASPTIASAPGQTYDYDLGIYLDELGTIPSSVTTGILPLNSGSAALTATSALAGFAGVPGTTYYWRVRVSANNPVQSYWSPMQSFAVQQLQAIVPVLNSPANGFAVTAGMSPAFSWNPIASATSYKFEVSTDPAFATTIYSTTTASAGAAIPSTVKLVAGTNYFWRVKTLTPAEGDWSAVSNFSIAAPVIVPTATTQVQPTVTVVLPPTTTTTIVIPPATTTTTEVNPSYIWAIIIIGAVLVIAVIVLIVRTRRSV